MKALLLALALTSCSHNVFVVDQNGNPVEDAQIRPQARSFSYPPVTTNAKGSAFIHQDLPTTETLHVWKMGYQSPSPVNFDLPKPIKVVLQKR